MAKDGTITIRSAALAIQAVNVNGFSMDSGLFKQANTIRRKRTV